jgi:hypothetical protein
MVASFLFKERASPCWYEGFSPTECCALQVSFERAWYVSVADAGTGVSPTECCACAVSFLKNVPPPWMAHGAAVCRKRDV